MQFQSGDIAGVVWKPLAKHVDGRGWLCELFRHDELPEGFRPAMAYVSQTEPGSSRGPHEHVEQTDYFCFLGPSTFRVYLWDARPASVTFGYRQIATVGQERPMTVLIPPGVVHAYLNVGDVPGLVLNAPNRLYKGFGRQHTVDEIRHESSPDSAYRFEDNI